MADPNAAPPPAVPGNLQNLPPGSKVTWNGTGWTVTTPTSGYGSAQGATHIQTYTATGSLDNQPAGRFGDVNGNPVGPGGTPTATAAPAQSATAPLPGPGQDPNLIGYGFNLTPSQIANNITDTAEADKARLAGAVTSGQTNLVNAANATGGAGRDLLANGYDQQAYQQDQGAKGLEQGQQLADYNIQQGQQALAGMSALGGQANDASAFYGNQGVGQIANAGQDRAQQLQAIANLRGFYQQGAGPSAAEAQLALASDRTQANALSLANSGRGAGDAAQAQRMAMFANAGTQQTTNLQMAQLRADEEAKWRATQLAGMSQEQASLGNLQGADINAGNASGNLGASYADIAKGYYQGGVNASQGATGQANAALGTGQGYNANMTGNANTAAGQGISAYDSLSGQSNDLTKGAAAQGIQGAQQTNEYDQAAVAQRNALYANQLSTETQKYGADRNVQIEANKADAQQKAAIIGGIASVGAAAVTASDVRGKKDIKPIVELFRKQKADPMQHMMKIASLKKVS